MVTEADYSFYKFTPTERLVLEVLTARYRLGANLWTFGSDIVPTLNRLEEKKLINWKSGIVENTTMVWFTDLGKAVMLKNKFELPPDLKKRQKELRKTAKTTAKKYAKKETEL